MRRLVIDLDEPQMSAALNELEDLIRRRYPEARFDRAVGEDPAGAYLLVELDVDDLTDARNAFIDRLTDMQMDDRLRVYVRIDWPDHRIREDLRLRGLLKDEPAAPPAPRRPRRKAAPPARS